MESYLNHAKDQDIEIKDGIVLKIMQMGDLFGLSFKNDFVQTKSIILATGSGNVSTIEGEDRLLGKGVSYCATCDGMFYKNKDVVIIGETEDTEDVNFLSEICKTVYYIPKNKNVRDISPKVKIVEGKPKEIVGTDNVENIVTTAGILPVDGVFFTKSSMPLTTLIDGLDLTNEGGIKVTKNMETNIKGLFAAGDCTGWPLQLSNAIGEGLVAAQAADRYLRNI